MTTKNVHENLLSNKKYQETQPKAQKMRTLFEKKDQSLFKGLQRSNVAHTANGVANMLPQRRVAAWLIFTILSSAICTVQHFTVQGSLSSTIPCDKKWRDTDNTNATAYFVIKDTMPVSTIEHVEF